MKDENNRNKGYGKILLLIHMKNTSCSSKVVYENHWVLAFSTTLSTKMTPNISVGEDGPKSHLAIKNARSCNLHPSFPS